jgi:hypothetical protein
MIFDFINSDEFDGLVRHILTTVGGMTLVTGHMDPSQWQTIAGAVATLLGVAWSVANKKYMREKVKA